MASVAALSGRYSKLSWTTAFFMTLFHIGAVWALFQFTWEGLAVFLVTYHTMIRLGLSPTRLKAFVLNLGAGPDVEQARASRRALLAHCAAHSTLVFPGHVGAPFAGRIEASASGFVPRF